MTALGRKSRHPTGFPAVACALLDALALWLDLGAARGRQPLLRAPVAIAARALSWAIAVWSTSWIGTALGLSWLMRTYHRGKWPLPPGFGAAFRVASESKPGQTRSS